jgi:hypothetical protein
MCGPIMAVGGRGQAPAGTELSLLSYMSPNRRRQKERRTGQTSARFDVLYEMRRESAARGVTARQIIEVVTDEARPVTGSEVGAARWGRGRERWRSCRRTGSRPPRVRRALHGGACCPRQDRHQSATMGRPPAAIGWRACEIPLVLVLTLVAVASLGVATMRGGRGAAVPRPFRPPRRTVPGQRQRPWRPRSHPRRRERTASRRMRTSMLYAPERPVGRRSGRERQYRTSHR